MSRRWKRSSRSALALAMFLGTTSALLIAQADFESARMADADAGASGPGPEAGDDTVRACKDRYAIKLAWCQDCGAHCPGGTEAECKAACERVRHDADTCESTCNAKLKVDCIRRCPVGDDDCKKKCDVPSDECSTACKARKQADADKADVCQKQCDSPGVKDLRDLWCTPQAPKRRECLDDAFAEARDGGCDAGAAAP